MDSKRHFLISLALGVALVILLETPLPALAVVAYATILGVAIDFDHFLVSRLHRGDWRVARRCLDDPKIVFLDQGAIFEVDDIWSHQRLLSHVLLAGLVVSAAFLAVGPSLALVSAAVLYAHVLADLIEDNRNHERLLQRAARVADSTGSGPREERDAGANPTPR